MKILTLTGPSCSGKTTLLNKLVADHGFQNIVSHTTRPPRPGEVYGQDYYFVPQEVFDLMRAEGKFIENISFNGFSYGVSVEEIEAAHKSGKVAALIVEPNGLRQIKHHEGESTGIKSVSVYIDGELPDLMARYIKRLAGEDLSAEGVAERHAKRLQSMIAEQKDWSPDQYPSYAQPYRLVLDKYTPENEEVVIKLINDIIDL